MYSHADAMLGMFFFGVFALVTIIYLAAALLSEEK